jgi:hypothetical protein
VDRTRAKAKLIKEKDIKTLGLRYAWGIQRTTPRARSRTLMELTQYIIARIKSTWDIWVFCFQKFRNLPMLVSF